MAIRIFIARLLSILAIASFVIGPVMAQRAWAANAMDGPMAGQMAGMAAMSGAMDSMECCPEHKPTLPDSRKKECPCASLCAASCLSPLLPGAVFSVLISWNAVLIASGDDQDRDRMADPPPPRPPRT